MAFTLETFIQAPLEKVFEFATDYRNATSVMDNVVETEKLTDGPVQQGTKIKEVREIRGRKAEAIQIVTEYLPNQKYSVKSVQNDYTIEYHYSFTAKEDGTTVHFKGEIRTRGIKNILFKPMFERIIKVEDSDHLDRLKKLLEPQAEEEAER